MWNVTADPDRFDEAVAWLRRRVPVTRADYDTLSAEAKLQSFTIGGTQQLNVVQTVLEEITRAVAKGAPIDDFRTRIAEVLDREYVQKNSARLTTSFRTTTQTAYSSGRWFEMDTDIVRATHPWRVYDAVLDARTTQICINIDGKIYHYTDPFLLTHWTPLHWNCRTGIRAIRTKQAMDIGPQPPPKHSKPDEGFGLAPPLREKWEPKRTEFDPKAFAEYERKQRQLERKAKPKPKTKRG